MTHLSQELAHARTCYKHLAGELGVSITREFLSQGLITDTVTQNKHCFSITDVFRSQMGDHWRTAKYSVMHNHAKLTAGAHDITKSCLDHSHREPHIAGELGRAILDFMLANDYCRRASNRHVLVTASGIRFLHATLGIHWNNHLEEMKK